MPVGYLGMAVKLGTREKRLYYRILPDMARHFLSLEPREYVYL